MSHGFIKIKVDLLRKPSINFNEQLWSIKMIYFEKKFSGLLWPIFGV